MDGVCSPRKSVNKQSDPNGFQEEAASNNEQECQSESQVIEYDEILQVLCEATSLDTSFELAAM
jgi:hypothetical protein